jgi:hypothetical protein
MATDADKARERLEYLRGEIRAERISYGEIFELESLAEHIAPDDVELLQWAGVPEPEVDVIGEEQAENFRGWWVQQTGR